MRRTLALAAGCAVLAGLLAGCSQQPAAGSGTVTGRLLRVGGPSPGAAVPLSGQVVATNAAGLRFSAAAGGSGRYRLSLPPGTYRLTGHSPLVYADGAQMLCIAARAVRLHAGQTAEVDVICSVS